MLENEYVGHHIKFTIDISVFPMETVLRAAYLYIDRYYVSFERVTDNRLRVTMKCKDPREAIDGYTLSGTFENDLLHEVLRRKVNSEQAKIREMILARALFSSYIEEDLECVQPTDVAYMDEVLFEQITTNWFDAVGDTKADFEE